MSIIFGSSSPTIPCANEPIGTTGVIIVVATIIVVVDSRSSIDAEYPHPVHDGQFPHHLQDPQ